MAETVRADLSTVHHPASDVKTDRIELSYARPMPWANQYRRSEESRRAILTAALDLCREVGYAALRIEAIARRAGAGKQTIYRWWPTKGALLLDALTTASSGSAVFPDTGDLVVDLRAQMSSAAEAMSAFRSVLVGLIEGAQHDPALAEQLTAELVAPRRAACLARLRAAVDRGELAPGTDVELLVDQLYGPLYYRLLVAREPLDDAYVRRHLAALLPR